MFTELFLYFDIETNLFCTDFILLNHSQRGNEQL